MSQQGSKDGMAEKRAHDSAEEGEPPHKKPKSGAHLGSEDGATKREHARVKDVNVRVGFFRLPVETGHVGLLIDLPIGKDNEDHGFGTSHVFDRSKSAGGKAPRFIVEVAFPAGNYSSILGPPPAHLHDRFPADKHAGLHLKLNEGAFVQILNFGYRFRNPGHPSDDWINKGTPIEPGTTFFDMLRQREWFIVVGLAADKFALKWRFTDKPIEVNLPYDRITEFDLGRYEKEWVPGISRGKQYPGSSSFSSFHHAALTITQGAVQDVLWIAKAASKFLVTYQRAYFVPIETNDGVSPRFYAIVHMGRPRLPEEETAWSRLTKDGRFRLAFWDADTPRPSSDPDLAAHESWKKLPTATGSATIIEYPEGNADLTTHPVGDNEMVLMVQTPSMQNKEYEAKRSFQQTAQFSSRELADQAVDAWATVTFLFDPQISDLARKVNAVNTLKPDAEPFNPVGCGWKDKHTSPQSTEMSIVPEWLRDRMNLERDLFVGRGLQTLWDKVKTQPDSSDKLGLHGLSLEGRRSMWELPGKSLLDEDNSPMMVSLLEHVPEEDRNRFQAYMRSVPGGLAIMTAGPGFAKTTALSVVTLAMTTRLKKVYLSAPSNIAVDNFAMRVSEMDKGLAVKLGGGYEGKVVVRGYKISDEIKAFKTLLRRPTIGDEAAPKAAFKGLTRWKLNLSLTYWALRVIGHSAVPKLADNDKRDLWQLREAMQTEPKFRVLFQLANGEMTWDDFADLGSHSTEDVDWIFQQIVNLADFVATTPAISQRGLFDEWRREQARGFAIDEAANMTRPDFVSVWGNTFMPCILAGDDKQLKPTVMTHLEKDSQGNFLNRHAEDAGVSALSCIKDNYWPTYRLRKQFRMASGMFDLCHDLFYRDEPFEYGSGADITLPAHADGRKVEQYFVEQYGIEPSPAGRLEPIFLHCANTRTWRNAATGSMTNVKQTKAALELVKTMVSKLEIPAEKIAVICPYKANVLMIETWRRKRIGYSLLAPMRPAATVDSFQGQEADVVVVVMGTTTYSGPGFTARPNRLCVMLSRQRSALIIVGDIEVAHLEKAKRDAEKRKGDKKGVIDFRVSVPTLLEDGQRTKINAQYLREAYNYMDSRGRVAKHSEAVEAVKAEDDSLGEPPSIPQA